MEKKNNHYQKIIFEQVKRYQNKKRHQSPTPHLDLNSDFSHHPNLSRTQDIGLSKEELAIDFLVQQGLSLLAKNLACKIGEIDAVMKEQEDLVFIEVRYRQSQLYGDAASSISLQKQLRIKRTAAYFLPLLTQSFFTNITPQCRFDVIAINGLNNQITWLKHAFS